MITKLKWQWQSSTNDMSNGSTSTRTSTPNPQYGRVITGMLTGGADYSYQPTQRTSGKGTPSGDNGF